MNCQVRGRAVLARYVGALGELPAPLGLDADHELGYGLLTDPGTQPVWRTYDLARSPTMSGATIRGAAARVRNDGRRELRVAFDAHGRAALAALTAPAVGKRLAIVIDGVVQDAPVLGAPLTDGRLTIDLGRDQPFGHNEDVRTLVEVLRVGALPTAMREVFFAEIEPDGSLRSAE